MIHLSIWRNHSRAQRRSEQRAKRLDSMLLANSGWRMDDFLSFVSMRTENATFDPFPTTKIDYLRFSQYDPKLLSTIHKHIPPIQLNEMRKCSSLVHSLLPPELSFSLTPILKMKMDCVDVHMTERVKYDVRANIAFRKVFGRTETELIHWLQNSLSGFLPYGISLMTLLAASEKELLEFSESQCAKMTSMGFPDSLPWELEFPNVSIMKLLIRESTDSSRTKPVDCTVTCVNRTLRDWGCLYEEIFFKIEPHENVDHLWEESIVDGLSQVETGLKETKSIAELEAEILDSAGAVEDCFDSQASTSVTDSLNFELDQVFDYNFGEPQTVQNQAR